MKEFSHHNSGKIQSIFFYFPFLLYTFLPPLLGAEGSGLFSQPVLTFNEKFNQAKNYFAYNETKTALKIFKELYREQPNNSNINYLLGVCYMEEEPNSEKSTFHLEKAVKDVSVDYDASSFSEKRTPIFVYYYLTIAYSQHGKCDNSKQAKNYFHTLYGIDKNDYYISDAEKWVKKCRENQSATGSQSAKSETSQSGQSAVNNQQSTIITKNIDYTYSASLYGVQVAALSRLAPVYEFPNLKNVEAFMDKKGIIRYVIGHFIFKEQAETLLKAVMDAGYKDAFVVDVNKEKFFSEEVIIANEASIHNAPAGKSIFKVQIGAFRTTIPPELVSVFLKIEGIEEKVENGLTIISAGNFSTYEDAEKKKNELVGLGIHDAFIVAYSENKKIDVKLARNMYKK